MVMEEPPIENQARMNLKLKEVYDEKDLFRIHVWVYDGIAGALIGNIFSREFANHFDERKNFPLGRQSGHS